MSKRIDITFMRHAWSRADDEHVHEGRYDSPLTDKGSAQIKKRAEYFYQQNASFDLIIASPLKRAHESAEIIAKKLNLKIETDDDWMELDNGPVAGISFEKAELLYPKPDFRNPYEPYFETGESNWQAFIRAARAVENLIRRGTGNYLVVAHGGILNAALRTIVGASPTANRQGIIFALGDTGFASFVYLPEQHIWILNNLEQGY